MRSFPEQNIAVLGATGSIGKSAAAVIAASPERFRLVAAAANENCQEMMRQYQLLKPEIISFSNSGAARRFAADAPAGVKILSGEEAMVEIATLPQVDTLLCAVPGIAGVAAVLAALRAGKRVALASKEVLVFAGDIIASEDFPGELIPVDSEHSGVFQSLAGSPPEEVLSVTLTASGGPFRNWSMAQLEKATYQDAVKHPVWSMGSKISVDSATLMNKALELIEARHLFNLRPEQVKAVIHPQSIVHAMVELCDGSAIAQLSNPDMKLAIQYAFSWPLRLDRTLAGRLNLAEAGKLEFFAPDEERFPALRLGRMAMEMGGAAPAILNAANEEAVELFRLGKIGFTGISRMVEIALERVENVSERTLEVRIAADIEARETVRRAAGGKI